MIVEATETTVNELTNLKELANKLKPGDMLQLVLPFGQENIAVMPAELARLADINQTGELNAFLSIKLDNHSTLEVVDTTEDIVKLKIVRVRQEDKIAAEFTVAKNAILWDYIHVLDKPATGPQVDTTSS